MPILYNTDPAKVDLFAIQGDAIYMDFYINSIVTSSANKFYTSLNIAPSEGTPYFINALRMQVKRKDGLLLKDWRSDISPADILLDMVYGGYAGLFDQTGFLESGEFDYDLQCDTGSGIFTIMTGQFFVKKQITP